MNAAVITVECEHCRDLRFVSHPRLGIIRCVRCTRREPRNDVKGMREFVERCKEQALSKAESIKYVREITGLTAVVVLLGQWGRRVRDHGIGYPHMSTTEKARVGRGGGQFDAPLPPDLQAVDIAVMRSPAELKSILVEHYTKFGYVKEKAAHLAISRETYYQRKAKAERHIANEIGL